MTEARKIRAILSWFSCVSWPIAADPAPKVDARYPFRTDFANEHLTWYQPKPGEFPPHHSDRRISGELVSADFIHRRGTFRATKTGELVDFTLPPYGSILYLNAESDLRDVPLGTFFLFFLHPDADGNFTRLATAQDRYTMDANHAYSYRLDKVLAGEGRLLTTRQSRSKQKSDLGPQELRITPATRLWKGEQRIGLADLVPGDELLFTLSGRTATDPGWCPDVWVGADTHELVTRRRRETFTAFTKRRGLPGWIDRVEKSTLTVTLFSGDAKSFRETYLAGLPAIGGELNVTVANDELRTWNPPVDRERAKLVEVRQTPVNAYGTGGVQLVFTVPNMLEGFRRGRIVRIFPAGWPLKDQFYGESLMGYGYTRLKTAHLEELPPKEYPVQFPFRTDHGNAHLPWYQLQPGVPPPRYSERIVFGELLSVDPERCAGRFRWDRSERIVEFTLTGDAVVRHLNADVPLASLPPGTRFRFSLYQDEKGEFTRATVVSDEFSELARNVTLLRIEALQLEAGRLQVAHQIAPVKNYNGDMEQPPDIARGELTLDARTRVWKDRRQVDAGALAVGDLLLVNVSGRTATSDGVCTEIWAGAETHAWAAERLQPPATAAR